MDIPETELADLILRVARRLRRANAIELQGLPVNPHQARALRLVARLEPVRMADLAEHLHVAARSATDVVDSLVAGGWVARSPDPADGRARLLSLTASGERLLSEVLDARTRAADGALAGISPETRTHLAAALEGVLEATEAG
ncbi:MarR family winged helix-turn-helix transcriptional regulator [Propioniciclava sinopodophylli]|uniref:MarR family winged helix-turn-helix transcriptional regulator n=1 Tax=Propioniciclava sinopodophylli TaxID=1837344 RepID=UPI0013F17051|nr:MarR family transcriptional regulator [Propioniciclava sinopodophylli]